MKEFVEVSENCLDTQSVLCVKRLRRKAVLKGEFIFGHVEFEALLT